MKPNISEEAQILNTILGPYAQLLSETGLRQYYPIFGILPQAKRSEKTNPNGTAGIAKYDSGKPMTAWGEGDAFKENIKDFQISPADVLYEDSFGNPALRDALDAAFLKEYNLADDDISRIVITNGGSGALAASRAFVDGPVYAPDKGWDNLKLIFEVEMGVPILRYPLFDKYGGMNIEGLLNQLEKSKDKKRILYLNSPNNPTGAVYTEPELKELLDGIQDIAKKGIDIFAIVDDAYSGFVYNKEGSKKSIFVELSKLDEHVTAFQAYSASKIFDAWGFRVGGVRVGNAGMTKKQYDALLDKIAGGVRGTDSNISRMTQAYLSKIMGSPKCMTQLDQNKNILASRYHALEGILVDMYDEISEAGLEKYRSGGGYFTSLGIKDDLIGSKSIDAHQVGELLRDPTRYNTGIISLNTRDDGNSPADVIRVSFSAIPKDKLQMVIENICNACNDYKRGVRIGNSH